MYVLLMDIQGLLSDDNKNLNNSLYCMISLLTNYLIFNTANRNMDSHRSFSNLISQYWLYFLITRFAQIYSLQVQTKVHSLFLYWCSLFKHSISYFMITAASAILTIFLSGEKITMNIQRNLKNLQANSSLTYSFSSVYNRWKISLLS